MIPEGLAVTAAEWEIVRGVLDEHAPGVEVWAFGSRVHGAALPLKPMADLDLVMVTQCALPLHIHAGLTEAFRESDLPWKVDLVDWSLTSPEFRCIIAANRVGVRAGAPDRP